MAIYIENLQSKLEISAKHILLIEQCMEKILENEKLDIPVELNILIVDNDEIRNINREHRNVDSATDVLSFPMVEMHEGEILSMAGDFDLDENSLILGDIIISAEKAREQAEQYGHSFEREIGFLSTHGLLHILGYDHETPEQEQKMRDKQETVLKAMGLCR